MSATRISFKREGDNDFARELKKEVNNFFKENNISSHANSQMVVKTIILLTLYFGAYGLIISNIFGLLDYGCTLFYNGHWYGRYWFFSFS